MTAATNQALEVVYQTTVTAVGDQVPAFLDAGILILFAAGCPDELHAMSVRHQAEVEQSGPQAGDLVEFGDHQVEVLSVGDVVGDNLLSLGHADFKADGRSEAKLPGDVCLPVGSLRQPVVGQTLRILRRSDHDSTASGDPS